MDICFKALQGTTTRRMADDAAAARPTNVRRASRALASTPLPYGDISGLSTWFLFSIGSRSAATRGDLDVAA